MGHSTSESAGAAVQQLLALPPRAPPHRDLRGQQPLHDRRDAGVAGARGEVALVGFDDFELADLLGVTVVRTDPYRIGQVAAQLAFNRIEGDARPPQRVLLPVDLVARGSGEIAPP